MCLTSLSKASRLTLGWSDGFSFVPVDFEYMVYTRTFDRIDNRKGLVCNKNTGNTELTIHDNIFTKSLEDCK